MRGLLRYDLTSSSSPAAVATAVAFGAIGTFLVIFLPLAWLIGLPLPFLALKVLGKRSLTDNDVTDDDDNNRLVFPIDRWRDEMDEWIRQSDPNSRAKRYRCCLYPSGLFKSIQIHSSSLDINFNRN